MKKDEDGSITLTREELYEEVWTTPIVRLAKKYGLSDVGLAKFCDKLRIPRPMRGYWAKLLHGKKVRRTPLPRLEELEASTVTIHPNATGRPGPNPRFEHAPKAATIKIPSRLVRPHPLVCATRHALEHSRPVDGILQSSKGKHLDVRVSRQNLSRALRIMQALLKECEKRGWTVTVRSHPKRGTFLDVDGEWFQIALFERRKQTKHIPTKGERPWAPKWDYVPSGVLTLAIPNCWIDGVRKSWSDGKTHGLEEKLGSFVSGLQKAAKLERARREENERRWRVEQERLRQVEEEQQRRLEEQKRLEQLEDDAKRWQRSQLIRDYVAAALSSEGRHEGMSADWGEWALAYADALDPLSEPHNR